MAAVDLWSLGNPVFSFYVLCSAILLLKTILMSIFTGYKRTTLKNFSFPEDNSHAGVKSEVKPPHPDVERVRRCHQNDLENIPPFVLIGLLYTLTNPSVTMAKLYLGVFTFSRLAHTIIFLNAVPQPARFLSFLVGLIMNIAMVVSVIIHVLPLCFALL